MRGLVGLLRIISAFLRCVCFLVPLLTHKLGAFLDVGLAALRCFLLFGVACFAVRILTNDVLTRKDTFDAVFGARFFHSDAQTL